MTHTYTAWGYEYRDINEAHNHDEYRMSGEMSELAARNNVEIYGKRHPEREYRLAKRQVTKSEWEYAE